MFKLRSKVLAAAATGVFAVSLAACSSVADTVETATGANTSSETGSSQNTQAENNDSNTDTAELESAIQEYVDFERSDLEKNGGDQFAEVYDSVTVNGALVDGVAQIDYRYVFKEIPDWDAAAAGLDQEFSGQIDSMCADVFSNMESLGIDVPKKLIFAFTDISAPEDTKWSMDCAS